MHLRAYAKFNPYLKIENAREDGYHDLSIIFRPVSLYDELYVEIDTDNPSGVSLTCDKAEFAGEDNIIYKAYNALKKYYPSLPAFKVRLLKNIPSGAGMGGGSSDASAFLYAASKLAGLSIDIDELAKIGAGIGADVPACLYRVPTYGTGIGEKLEKIKTKDIHYYIVVKPDVSFNTGKMYGEYDRLVSAGKIKQKTNHKAVIKKIESGDIKGESKKYYNVFEQVVPERKLIYNIKKELVRAGAIGSVMTGSGSAVFGSFASKKERNAAYKKLIKKLDCNVLTCEDVIEKKRELSYVYILEMEDGSLYTGYTNDLDKRLKAHNSKKGAKYTKAHGLGKIVYTECFDTKNDALSREYAIKQLTKKQKLELINSANI